MRGTPEEALDHGIARLRALEAHWRAHKAEQSSQEPIALRRADLGQSIPTRLQSTLARVQIDPIGCVLAAEAREIGWYLCAASRGTPDLMRAANGSDAISPGFSAWLDHRWDGIGGWMS